jgi:hypothetical protein
MQDNPYVRLGVMRDATQAEIDHATRGLIARSNDELAQGLPGAQERLDAIHAAYRTIGSEAARAEYTRLEAAWTQPAVVTLPSSLVPAVAGVGQPRAAWVPPTQEFEAGTPWQPWVIFVGGILALLGGFDVVRDTIGGAGLGNTLAHTILFTPPGLLAGLIAVMLGRSRVEAVNRLDHMHAMDDTRTNRERFEALSRNHTLTVAGLWCAKIGLGIMLGYWALISLSMI